MESTTETAHRADVYTIITQKIIEQLEKGAVPWQQPWHDAGIPRNLISGKDYTGINLMLLAMLGYSRNYFLTFNQVEQLGGRVKQGERGHIVVFWKHGEKKTEDAPAEEETKEADSEAQPEERKKSVLRYFVVFNVQQCDIPPSKLPEMLEPLQFEPIAACEAIVENMPNKPQIVCKEPSAYYDCLRDIINMPKAKLFKSKEAYYATLFHELTHASGHSSRMNRSTITQMAEFGSDPYSQEELIAELGSSYLLSYAGIETEFQQSAAYIQGWLWQLKNDNKLIFNASRMAAKGVDYILGQITPSSQLQG